MTNTTNTSTTQIRLLKLHIGHDSIMFPHHSVELYNNKIYPGSHPTFTLIPCSSKCSWYNVLWGLLIKLLITKLFFTKKLPLSWVWLHHVHIHVFSTLQLPYSRKFSYGANFSIHRIPHPLYKNKKSENLNVGIFLIRAWPLTYKPILRQVLNVRETMVPLAVLANVSRQNDSPDPSGPLWASISPANIKESWWCCTCKCECNYIANACDLPQQAYEIKNYTNILTLGTCVSRFVCLYVCLHTSFVGWNRSVVQMKRVEFLENALFKSYGGICWSSRSSSLLDELSMNKRDSDDFFSTRVVYTL